jgi:hypothetical protein
MLTFSRLNEHKTPEGAASKIGLRSTEVGSLNLMCESPKAFPVLVKEDANLLSAERTQNA